MDARGFFMAADGAARLPHPRPGRAAAHCWFAVAYSFGKVSAYFAADLYI